MRFLSFPHLTRFTTIFIYPVITIALLLSGMIFPAIQAASFDCQQASLMAEKMICKTEALSQLDERIAQYYQFILTALPQKDATVLRNQQSAWIKARNRCSATSTNIVQCLERKMILREQEMKKKASQSPEWRLDTIIAEIPADPQQAASKLKKYQDPLASAWLAYLQRFKPASGLSKEDGRKYFQAARSSLIDDTGSLYVLDREIKETGMMSAQSVLLLLRMVIERAGYGDIRPYVHCFVFKQHGQEAYSAFGPIYGSSRDDSSPLCEPEGNLFQQAAWNTLRAALMPLVILASNDTGTIRSTIFAGWRKFELAVSIDPGEALRSAHYHTPKMLPEQTMLKWKNQAYPWPESDRIKALALVKQAKEVTAHWLVTEKRFTKNSADDTAEMIVRQWLLSRLDFMTGDDIGPDKAE